MAEVIPSIIGHNFEEVKTKIDQAEGLVAWAQLDVMDGSFTVPTGWCVAEDLATVGGTLKLEAHLMVNKPEEIVADWSSYVDRVLVHLESTDYLNEIIDGLTHSPCRLGIVLGLDTPIEELDPYEGKFDHVQLMSIKELGHYGADFDEKVYDKIIALKEKFPSVTISIDGGVDLDNARKLIEAGADNLVVGSALWNSPSLKDEIEKFKQVVF